MTGIDGAPDPLRILIFDENRLRGSIIEAGLIEAGYRNVVILTEPDMLMRRIADVAPDVIIMDLGSPERDRLESMLQVSRASGRPTVIFVDRSDRAATEAAIEAGVSAYIVDGLKKDRVKPILDMAVMRFNAYARLQRELEEARSALAERKTIDRAKGILMTSRGLSEDAAYALLRKTAMNQNRRIADVAQGLVLAAGLLTSTGDDQ